MTPDGFDFEALERPLTQVRSTPSASDTVVADVKRALFAGEIKSGSFLGAEKDLVQKYGAGRHSIRDALRSLSAVGLVDVRRGAHGGAVVSNGNMDRFAEALAIQFKLAEIGPDQILMAQSAIEGMAAELAATQRTPDDLGRLAELLAQSETLYEDPIAFSRNGLAFHTAIARASRNAVLVALLGTLRFVIWSSRPRSLPKVAAKVHGIHRQLFELIEAGRAQEAGSLMRNHIVDIRSQHLPGKDRGEPSQCC